jgi:hypothetical protein
MVKSIFWFFLKGQNFISFPDQAVQVIHPADGAGAGSHQTVGLETNASDVEISLEFIDFNHDIELFRAALFKEDSLPEHENADFVSFLYSYIGQSHGVVNGLAIIGGNDDQGFHGVSFQLKGLSGLQTWPAINGRKGGAAR